MTLGRKMYPRQKHLDIPNWRSRSHPEVTLGWCPWQECSCSLPMSLDLPSQTLNFLTETARGTGKHIVLKEPGNVLCFVKPWAATTPVVSIPLTRSAFTLEAGFKSERSVAYSKALGQNSSGIQSPVLGAHMSLTTIMFSFWTLPSTNFLLCVLLMTWAESSQEQRISMMFVW